MTNQELQNIKNKFDIIGNDPALNAAIEIAVAVAPTDLTVLISGESGVDRYFEQQVSLAAFTDATPTTLDDIPVTWASTPARELGITLADRMMQKITHEETHSRNLIIPARLIAAK